MKLKTQNDYVQKAFELKRILNDFFNATLGNNKSITDVNPYLVRHGVFLKDEYNGMFLRQFLKELKKRNLLKLVPHIKHIKKNNKDFWSFNRVSSNLKQKQFIPKIKSKSKYYDIITKSINKNLYNYLTDDEVQKTKEFVKKLPKRNLNKKYDSIYDRNFANWSYDEIRLLIRFLNKTNDIALISKIIGRSTNSIKVKYEELKFINNSV